MLANRTRDHWIICIVIAAGIVFGFHLAQWMVFPISAIATTLLPNDYSLTESEAA